MNVRVNVHFMQTNDGKGNFTAFNDGHPTNPNTSLTGYDYAEALIWAANGHWSNNPALTIAPGNTLSPQPKRIRLLLNGVYFHADSALRTYHDYMNPSAHIVDGSNTINIFITEVALNRQGLPAVPPQGGGLAKQVSYCSGGSTTNLWTCITSPWSNYVVNNAQAWQYASVLNHEIAHLLGLNHTWYGASGCTDAPANANCWNLNQPAGSACNDPNKVSNNLMDYNASQIALSPCQLNIMYSNLESCLSAFVHSCSNCLPSLIRYTLPLSKVRYANSIIVDGRASYAEQWFKVEIDQVNSQNQIIAGTHYENTFWRQMAIENLSSLYTFNAGARYRIHISGGDFCGYPPGSQTEYITVLANITGN